MKDLDVNSLEIWKDIKDYEGIYQVSNLGRVKSLERQVLRSNKKIYRQKEHIMKNYDNKRGYLYVVLSKKDCILKRKYIHKMVAEAFLNCNNYKYNSNEKNKRLDKKQLQVNHIDGNKLNNNVNNLEWCTRSYNLKEAFRLGLNKSPSKGKKGDYALNRKKVSQYDLDMNFIKTWGSIITAQNELNIYNISKCCRNKVKTAGGYIWRYTNE